MNKVSVAIAERQIIAVVRLDDYGRAVEVAQALQAGGVSVIEFTLTGAGANRAISEVRETLGDTVIVGVGTVLDVAAAQESIRAGATFVVTPVVRPAVVEACRAADVPVMCGALTPTEALTAYEAGADMIKIFPARAMGSVYLKDLLAPLPMLRLVPTGGITPDNLRDYLSAGAVAVGIGGNLVSAKVVAAGDWAAITAAARQCVMALG